MVRRWTRKPKLNRDNSASMNSAKHTVGLCSGQFFGNFTEIDIKRRNRSLSWKQKKKKMERKVQKSHLSPVGNVSMLAVKVLLEPWKPGQIPLWLPQTVSWLTRSSIAASRAVPSVECGFRGLSDKRPQAAIKAKNSLPVTVSRHAT